MSKKLTKFFTDNIFTNNSEISEDEFLIDETYENNEENLLEIFQKEFEKNNLFNFTQIVETKTEKTQIPLNNKPEKDKIISTSDKKFVKLVTEITNFSTEDKTAIIIDLQKQNEELLEENEKLRTFIISKDNRNTLLKTKLEKLKKI